MNAVGIRTGEDLCYGVVYLGCIIYEESLGLDDTMKGNLLL